MLDLVNVLNACEQAIGTDVPDTILNIVHYVYLAIQILVPIMLIIFGMIDLAKALTSAKEDEIKKAQSGLLRKAVTAIIVFLVFSLTKFVFNFAAGDLKKNGDDTNVWNCVSCFIGGPEDSKCKGNTSVNN